MNKVWWKIALLTLLSVGALGIGIGLATIQKPVETTTVEAVETPKVAEKPITINDLDAAINKVRIDHGLSPLSLNINLNSSALAKCNDMVSKNYITHLDPDGNEPWHFFEEAGYDYLNAAENQAQYYKTAKAIVEAWVASPSHKNNLISGNYTEHGFGVCESNPTSSLGKTNIIIQHLASPRPKEEVSGYCDPPPTNCNDGTTSCSVGRGTCSHHGGINSYN